jgi:hypothetical protein
MKMKKLIALLLIALVPVIALAGPVILTEPGQAASFSDDVYVAGDVEVAGDLTADSDTGLGWTIETGANTACNTTCGDAACVFGGDTATDFDLVACTGATADVCVCAGAAS